MNSAIALGPFVLSVSTLLLVVPVLVGYAVGSRLLGRSPSADRRLLVHAFIVAVVAARAAFVLEWSGAYAERPWEILAVGDGGWNLPVGILVAAVFVMGVRRTRPSRARGSRSIFAALALSLVAVVGGNALTTWNGPDKHIFLEPLVLSSIEGQTVRLAQFLGKPTVINLWATWCGPCRQEMPMFAEAQRREDSVNFVFANQGEDGATVESFLARERLRLADVLLDPRSTVGRASQAQGWPTTLFLDAQGRIVSQHVGALSKAALLKGIEATRRRD